MERSRGPGRPKAVYRSEAEALDAGEHRRTMGSEAERLPFDGVAQRKTWRNQQSGLDSFRKGHGRTHALAQKGIPLRRRPNDPYSDSMVSKRDVGGVASIHTWESREPCIPDDLDDGGLVKAQGKVTLPRSVYWSGPSPAYDLDDPRDRVRVYEHVLREGTADDVRHFVEVEQVVELWDRMVLPPAVRRGWAHWLHEHRGVTLRC